MASGSAAEPRAPSLVDLGVNLESSDTREYSTVAGIVLMQLGRIPDKPGDVAELEGWNN